ncbi:hypothetical protein [Tautonia plasticadhaerens]|uniref:Uncharacterized protein n=1 Tax=Tautonia plasticadhaerens TaxID=2527974 RepID=A0A518H8B8_9BACT|nr:hypothetical protein [Tautonia plasticadhaerens]QDV37065.1 hypothetical protein ElP_49980 [Tautonia plasticadhaerens]
MFVPILGVINAYWFALPLILAISLVYAASRHEAWGRILRHAARLFVMITGVLALATAILLLINTQV